MLFKTTITLLLATLAAAAPTKHEHKPNVRVFLNHYFLTVIEEYQAFTDGTAVIVRPTLTDGKVSFGSMIHLGDVGVSCISECPPEYHCKLYDTNLAPFATVLPGGTTFEEGKRGPIGLIICGEGKPSDALEPTHPPVLEAHATEP